MVHFFEPPGKDGLPVTEGKSIKFASCPASRKATDRATQSQCTHPMGSPFPPRALQASWTPTDTSFRDRRVTKLHLQMTSRIRITQQAIPGLSRELQWFPWPDTETFKKWNMPTGRVPGTWGPASPPREWSGGCQWLGNVYADGTLAGGSCRLPGPVRCASLTPHRVPGIQPVALVGMPFRGDTANSRRTESGAKRRKVGQGTGPPEMRRPRGLWRLALSAPLRSFCSHCPFVGNPGSRGSWDLRGWQAEAMRARATASRSEAHS